MLLSEPILPTISFQQYDGSSQLFTPSRHQNSDGFYYSAQTSPFSGSSDFDYDDSSVQSISASPSSTQSFPHYTTVQHSLGGFDNTPTLAIPRGAYTQHQMQADSSWASNGQLTPRSATRFSHHNRESSLSSLGSAGPSSPYSQHTSNPQVSVVDHDNSYGVPVSEDFNYQVATNNAKQSFNDTFYPNYPNYTPVNTANNIIYTQQNMGANMQQKNDRGMYSNADVSGSQQQQQGRPKPISVASAKSINGDSANPSGKADESGRGRNISFNAIPKLDRTMTDIYSDELFNPNFTVTSASPSQSITSPSNNELFTQRLHTANAQHLSVASPVSASSGGSPFRQGSPLAPAPGHDFSSSTGPSASMVFGSSQQLREQRKAAQDAQALQQQLAQDSDNSAPRTISPKDALIEYHTPEGENNFPLFPQQQQQQQQQQQNFKLEQMPADSQSSQPFNNNISIDGAAFAYAAAQLPHMDGHQHYSFPQQTSQDQQLHSGTASSRHSSAESEMSMSSYASNIQRPAGITADGGTYTCTYHGCTLRFETPALLQKHKREGHRSAHGLAAPRRSEPVSSPGMTSALNSQAGPHKCDRINPSTGKPCNIMFSRPYDLTRHEDTIHNAKKQKVRCNLCTDEKTFSRADALTRHYRVCHPQVEFPGKHRRRGGNSG